MKRPNSKNLSPLQEMQGVQFVGNSTELAGAFEKLAEGSFNIATRQNIFCLDHELPRWKSFLLSN